MWHTGLAVAYDTQSHEITFIPLKANDCGIELAKGEEREAILSAFAERNRALEDGSWRDRWHAFCEEKRERYVNETIGRAGLADSTERENDLFSHYLNCEAYTDVWRELFPSYNLTNEK
jgi:hypothetical protein